MQIGFTDPWWNTVQLRAAQAPFTFVVDREVDWTDYANVALAVVGLLLTAALVVVAVLEIRRASRAEAAALQAREGRERVAAVRISAEAYNAQTRLTTLLDYYPPDQPLHRQSSGRDEQAYASWAAGVEEDEDLAKNINALLNLADNASDMVFNAVEFAYTSFRKGKEEAVNCHLVFVNTGDVGIVMAHARAARERLQACASRLATVINPDLLVQTHRVQASDGVRVRG